MQTVESGLALLREATIQDVEDRHQHFLAATPYKHAVIDEFFDAAFARRLRDEFPSFEKPTPTSLRELGPGFAAADDIFSSETFKKWAEALTGIQGLAYVRESFWGGISPRFGAGVYQDADGREQVPHVDFKFDSSWDYRRRAGLTVFLNEAWQREWGGLMQLHPDLRELEQRGMRSYEPELNRCIVFETRKNTRHGFSKIMLPADRAGTSRKAMCVYLFTREPRNLTPRARLISYGADVASTSTVVLLPILGYVRQIGEPIGFHFDGWAGDDMRFSVEAVRAVTGVTLRASVPDQLPPNSRLEIRAGGDVVFSESIEPATEFCTTAPVSIEAGATQTLTIATSAHFTPRDLGTSQDPRALCFLVREIAFEHDAR